VRKYGWRGFRLGYIPDVRIHLNDQDQAAPCRLPEPEA